MIKTRTYPITDLFLNKGVVSSFIQRFWNEVYSPINKTGAENHLMVLVKVQYTESELGYKTLGHLRKVNFEDRNQFVNYIVERLSILNDSYTSISVNSITFSYIIREGLATGTRSLLLNTEDNVLSWHRFNNMNLPITMNPYEYGKVLSKVVIDGITRFIVSTNKKVFQIDVSLDNLINKVTILGASDLQWIDNYVSEGCFKREIGKSTIYFLDGVEVLRKQALVGKAFRRLQEEKYIQKYIVTMDVETIQRNNKLTPYLICAYNGTEYITSYADSSLNQKALFKGFFIKLLTFLNKKSILQVYAHNLSNFDGVFLLNQLVEYGKVDPLYFNGKLLSIKLKILGGEYNGKTIEFKDSYLLLPYSLRILCDVFKIVSSKGHFPFKLNNIFYSGVIPEISLWPGMTPNIYENLKKEFKNKMWNFQLEAINYCKLDCSSLHEILIMFNGEFFNKYKINIFSALTAPSLSMRLYKTHFMPENTIYQLNGNVEKAIRESYSGGAVDVFKPHNKIGSYSFSKTYRNIKGYDVNALYPTVMANQLMPIGQPIVFEGNIRTIDANAYGFFYCKITSPAFLEHPLLQRRIKTSEGTRTIAGLGSWTGWICSSEMDNAIKFGYTFEILRGYEFKLGRPFTKFILTMYELRQQYPKGHPLNGLAKQMTNSLYGKFGMRSEFTRVDIFAINSEQDKVLFKQLLDYWGTTVKDFVLLDNYFIVIRDSLLDLRTNPEEQDNYHGLDTNIALASAITAEARIHMSYFKNNPNFHIYYSDTDSIFIDGELPVELVGSALGQLKLEYSIKKAVFLAPKVYALVTEDGQEIIKVKGLTPKTLINENIHFEDIAKLLIQDSTREFNQEKWYKSITKGTITTADVAYTLKATSNKRMPVYIDGVYENTTPYFYNQIEEKENK
jgi:DNA polymerase type B, organellar and viral